MMNEGQDLPLVGFNPNPNDRECILNYLIPKYEGNIKPISPNKWLIFSDRKRSSRNSDTPKRRDGRGYWIGCGTKVTIIGENDVPLGEKQYLSYYRGDTRKNSRKTNWTIHEYVAAGRREPGIVGNNNNILDRFVLLKIFRKNPVVAVPVPIQEHLPAVENAPDWASIPVPNQEPLAVGEYVQHELHTDDIFGMLPNLPDWRSDLLGPSNLFHEDPLQDFDLSSLYDDRAPIPVPNQEPLAVGEGVQHELHTDDIFGMLPNLPDWRSDLPGPSNLFHEDPLQDFDLSSLYDDRALIPVPNQEPLAVGEYVQYELHIDDIFGVDNDRAPIPVPNLEPLAVVEHVTAELHIDGTVGVYGVLLVFTVTECSDLGFIHDERRPRSSGGWFQSKSKSHRMYPQLSNS